jgi:hypothetical protein
VHERTLRVHEIELVVKATPRSGDGSGVGKHAKATSSPSKIASRNECRGFIADTELETSRAPIDKLNRTLGFDGGNSSLNILGDNVSTVKQTARHVFAFLGIALHHLIARLEAREGHLCDGVLFMGSLLRREKRRVCSEGEMDTREGNQVRLELVQIDVEGAVEAERSSNRRDDLSNKPVKVGEAGLGNTKLLLADVVDSFVVDHEGAVGVLESGMGSKDRVVRLNDGARELGSRIYAELKLGLLSVIS